MCQRRRAAVLCFLPDAGHVVPLLRLARLFAQAGWEVTCHVGESFEATVRGFGFEYRPLQLRSHHRLARVARTLSNRSIFYNAFSNYEDLYDFYWYPLRAAVSQQLAGLADALQALQPESVLCDSHEFLDWYARLAQCCAARLIVNHADGTFRRAQRPFVQAYGYRSRGAAWQRLTEVSGGLSEQAHRLWRAVAHRARRRTAISEATFAREQAQIAFRSRPAAEMRQTHIVSGLAALERLSGEVPRARTGEVVLAPAIANEPAPLSGDLAAWVTAQRPASVIYVSFGTMVVLSRSMMAALVRGLEAVGSPVIWSLPASQHGALERHRIPESFRLEQFVPQKALLGSGKIRCFITHGGSNSCQETVALGVPALCVPFMWDQPYNCSLLVRLGMARLLPKQRLTPARVSREVRELLHDPRYARSARRWAHTLEELYGSTQQRESRRELVG